LIIGFGILEADPRPTSSSNSIEEAKAALSAAARAYQAVPALRDTMTYVVRSPKMDREPKKIEIRLGLDRAASVQDALLCATAVGHQFYLTKSDAPGKYIAKSFGGDFGKALVSVSGSQSSLFEPVQIAMREGKDLEGWLDSLRFNLLGPLKITGFRRRTDRGGRRLDEIELTAENGREVARLDAETNFFSSVHLWVKPAGAPVGVSVEIQGNFAPRIEREAAGVVAFDPGSRRAVAELADLDSASLPIGKPAPAFALETPEGRRIALSDYSGRVLILDFWATWCVPCWKTLAETQRFAEWAAAANQPVSVIAVNTMERFPTEQERRAKITDFFRSQGLTIPTVLDSDSKLFHDFGAPGLPSMVVLSPEGTIFKYHQGLFPDVLETLKREVAQAHAAPPQPKP
jgi:thiol-disulfide isomerase/thioredoxin